MELSENKIQRIRTADRDAMIRDSPGLFLHVRAGVAGKPIGRGAWIARITRNGKTRKSTLGHWPDMPVERARRERDRLIGVNTDMGITVQEMVDDYRHLVTDHLKSGYQSEVYLRDFIQSHGPRKIATVSRADVVAAIKRYSRDRGARSADRYLSQLRGIFSLAVMQGCIEQSPLLGVTKLVTGYKNTPRERILTADEIRLLWQWDHPNAALLRFLLLTGVRISEAQKGHRDGDRWIVPAAYSKNGREHWVQLSPAAVDQLTAPFDRSPTAVQAWVRRRQDCDDRWTPHDCRRTASTLMHDNGVEPFIVERVLNHTLEGVMAVYNRAEYEQPRIDAAQILERTVQEIVNG